MSGEIPVAGISKQDDMSFRLKTTSGREWLLTNKVDGKRRPFSLAVFEVENEGQGPEVLKIVNHLFSHKGRFYMMGNHPEGKHWNEYLDSKRYISRLDKFPFSDVSEVSGHSTPRLKKFMRGVPVGEAEGLGTHGHMVRVDRELEDIAVILAAASYLMYASA